MAAPYWLDENGQRVPTDHVHGRCGREYPLHRYSYETLRLIGWPLYRVASFINWCGHRQEFIPVPDEAGGVQCFPIIGEAR